MKSVDLVDFKLPPGLFRNGTAYQAKGRWYDAQLVRFFTESIRPVGGWVRMQDPTATNLVQLVGIPRAAMAYRYNPASATDDGPPYIVIGTNERLYVAVGKTLSDISPSNPIPATNIAPWPPVASLAATGSLKSSGSTGAGTTSITLTATTLTGTISAGDMLYVGNANILTQPPSDIVVVTGSPQTAAANSVTVSVTPAFANTWPNNTPVVYFNGTNRDTAASGFPPANSFGFGNFGAGNFGQGAGSASITNANTWQLDTFGQDVVAVNSVDGHMYYWAHNTANPAAVVPWGLVATGAVTTSGATPANSPTIAITAGTTLTGTILHGQQFTIAGVTYTALLDATAVANVATITVQPLAPAAGIPGGTSVTGFLEQSPTLNRAVVVTPERFIMLLGANGDPRQVAWADVESSSQWGALPSNSARQYKLKTNGGLLAGRRIRNSTVLWTDTDLWQATWIGGSYVYRFDLAGDHCGAISPNAMAVTDTQAYWMGINGFFVFNGLVQSLHCDVQDYVFGRLNVSQKQKIWAMPVAEFGEVWFFYPATSAEIDSYVIYNYRENHWTTGSLTRTCGDGSDSYPFPVMCDNTGLIYEHENGYSHSGTACYLESGPVELGDGNNTMSINRIAMDEKTLGDVTASMYVSYYPPGTTTTTGGGNDYSNQITFSLPTATTSPLNIRVTGRQARIRFTETNPSNPATGGFRIGNMRLGMTKGGTR